MHMCRESLERPPEGVSCSVLEQTNPRYRFCLWQLRDSRMRSYHHTSVFSAKKLDRVEI